MSNHKTRSVSTLSRRRFGTLALAAAAPLRASNPDLESFDTAWRIVRDRHWDPKLNGVDWAALRDELRPQAERAATRQETRRLILRMLAKLNQSHFGLIPSEVYSHLATNQEAGGADAGIRLRVLDGEALITDVRSPSPLRPGWIVRRIGDFEVKPALERLAVSAKSQLLQTVSIAHHLQGNEGAAIALECIEGDGTAASHTIRLTKPPGKLARFGLIPPTPVWLETTEPRPDIGLIRFNIFLDPPTMMDAFEGAIRRYRSARGIILDLRGNPGGLAVMAMGIAGWFVRQEDLHLGTIITRDYQLRFVVNPRADGYEGPLAILLDPLSVSTSEILAAGLRDLGRARIFGERSAGAALPSQFERLPNGDVLQFAFANYISASGVGLEGRGVEPDVEAPPTRHALLEGRDNALVAALTWIQNERKHSQ